MQQVVIMPGGFHPFHAGHAALYNEARRAFPGADVYVAATNDTSTRPFPFAVKEKLAKLAGVEPGHFVQVKSPFRAEEITKKFDPETDQLIFVRSEKDENKPPQAGIEAHFRAMADATKVPVMLYDIPGRTGVEIEPDTIVKLAEHKNIVALKDAKGNVASTSWVIKRCGIPVYSGDDILNLPLLSVGAVGFVSVCGHTVGKDLREMLDAWFAGNTQRALEIHQKVLPIYTGTFRTQGAILTKAALNLMGLPGGHTRLPLVDATPAQIEQLKLDLRAGGVNV